MKHFSDQPTITEMKIITESVITRQKFSLISRLLQKLEVLLILQSLKKMFSDEPTITNISNITDSTIYREKSLEKFFRDQMVSGLFQK